MEGASAAQDTLRDFLLSAKYERNPDYRGGRTDSISSHNTFFGFSTIDVERTRAAIVHIAVHYNNPDGFGVAKILESEYPGLCTCRGPDDRSARDSLRSHATVGVAYSGAEIVLGEGLPKFGAPQYYGSEQLSFSNSLETSPGCRSADRGLISYVSEVAFWM